jgi:transposase
MRKKKYVVTLTDEERQQLTQMIRSGKSSALVQARVRILLKADQADAGPAWDDEEIATALDVGVRTVSRVRQRFVERGLEAALERKKQDRPSAVRKLDGRAEARLLAIACSKPPKGRTSWTLKLLANKLVELEVVDSLSYETVRRVLKKTRSNRT